MKSTTLPETAGRRRLSRPVFLFLPLALLILFVNILLAQEASVMPAGINAGFTTGGIPTLIGPDGRTLYTFSHDDEGISTCYERCAEVWPPLIVETGFDSAAADAVNSNIPGQFGTTQRDDGSLQVTYNGEPLYYYFEDMAAGDANGQGIHDVWFAANPATVMISAKPGFGNILVGPGGMTLYVFLRDEVEDGEGESYCYEECADFWPPLLVPAGMEPLAGAGLTGELALTERLDGSQQVTYNGWPLYFFHMDRQPGDTKGNAAKNVWFTAVPEAEYDEQHSAGLELVAEGLAAPIALMSANDGSGRHFIADQAGKIWILGSDGVLMDEPFLDLTSKLVELMPGYDERGLLGLAFHPDYANNGRFFVFYSAPLMDGPATWSHTNVVSEFTVSPDLPNTAALETERIVWSLPQPQFNHDAGQIVFGPDGYLYIPIGDGGGGNDVGEGHTPGIGNAQDISNLHGSILRIDVDGEQPYSIPADNPFVGENDNIADEIYAYGLRNPFHLSFDSQGRLFASDAGQELFEEVNIITSGGNYGWNIKEATHCFDPNAPTEPPLVCDETGGMDEALINPIIEFDHRKGVTIVGGYLYEGSALPDLNGYYIFGNYSMTSNPPDGRIFIAEASENPDELWRMSELHVTREGEDHLGAYVLSFGMDEDGEIYVLTTESSAPTGDTGKVWRLTASTGDTGEEDASAQATAEPTPGS